MTFGTSRRSNNVARDERIANTCAAALGTQDDAAAFAALGLMKARVTNRNVSKQIARALETAAARRGMSPSELLELSIPTMGLDASGRREETIGDEVAVMAIDAEGEVSLAWRGPDGQGRANPPKAFVDAHAAEVRRLKEEAKELKKAVALERGRIEDLFVEDREWDIETWRQRYVRHPLSGTFGRRLIWRVVDGSSSRSVMPADDGTLSRGGWLGGRGGRGRAHSTLAPDRCDGDGRRLLACGAHRAADPPAVQAGIPRGLPAHPGRGSDGSGFGPVRGHILLYSQARALMLARRWGTNFLGPFDGGDVGIAKREFPSHGLRAEFRHDAIWPLEPARSEVTHCTTGQVRFIRIGDGEPVPLREVPAIVFSEAMRDVDLFVSVSSVGADRNWQDRGRAGGAPAASTPTGASTRTRRSRSWRGPAETRSDGSSRASRSRIAASSAIDGSWSAATCGHIGSTWAAATRDGTERQVPAHRAEADHGPAAESSCPSTTTRC